MAEAMGSDSVAFLQEAQSCHSGTHGVSMMLFRNRRTAISNFPLTHKKHHSAFVNELGVPVDAA